MKWFLGRQTDHVTQITSSCDLDEEVEMQGEGRGEDTGEPTQPTLPQSSGVMPACDPENEIDMQEGAGGVKRGQAEPES